MSRRRRPCWRPAWSPTRHHQRLSGIASSIQRPSTRARTPSASWPKTIQSASTSLFKGGIWSFISSDIFRDFSFHGRSRDSPSELLRVFLYILHRGVMLKRKEGVSQIYLKLLDARHTCQNYDITLHSEHLYHNVKSHVKTQKFLLRKSLYAIIQMLSS